MDALKDVNKQIEDLREKQHALESERFAKEIIPPLEAMIGKTFVYRDNCYSSDRKFDTFRRLRAVHHRYTWGYLVLEECQIDSNGRAKLEVVVDHVSSDVHMFQRGWRECDETEYTALRARVLEQFSNPTDAIAHLKKD